MIRNKYTYIAFLILSSQSLNASSIENNISLNNNEINKEANDIDFSKVKNNLIIAVNELHNNINTEGIATVIKCLSELSQFLLDQKDKFKCSDEIIKLAGFITNKIVEPSKEKENDEIISAFICNMSADLNAFSEKLYSLQPGKEDCKSSFYSFLCKLLNKKEINGVSVEVVMDKRPHFNINIDKKKIDKDILHDLRLKVLKKEDSKAVKCTRWKGEDIKIDEEDDNTFFSLLGKNKNKDSFAVCFPKGLKPSELNVVVYNNKGEEINFNF